MDTTILYTPLPSAWNTEPQTIQKPANRKLILIIRSAGMPIASMVSEASNEENNCAGNTWNTTRPTAIRATA